MKVFLDLFLVLMPKKWQLNIAMVNIIYLFYFYHFEILINYFFFKKKGVAIIRVSESVPKALAVTCKTSGNFQFKKALLYI